MSKVNPGLFSSNSGEWETPDDLFETWDRKFGGIPLDVCAWDWNTKCPVWFTIFDDALSIDWHWVLTEVLNERPLCWMNPPYGREIVHWVRKANEEMKKGVTTIALLPARTDTAWFHDYIWWECTDVYFLRGRVKFVGGSSAAPFPSMVVVFDGSVYP